MKVGIMKENFPGERRVALVPAVTPQLIKAGFEVLLERGAGDAAGFLDAMYQDSGAQLIDDRKEIFDASDIIIQVMGPHESSEGNEEDLDMLHENQVLIGMLDPYSSPAMITKLADRKITAFALELIPRTTRAQNMDVLSSQATVAGYKAVLLAADMLPKMFPMLMTAAGTIAPARVFVVGAGVAGLQAIATARRLGAVVYSYDIRPEVKEQVESLGAKFVELPLEEKNTAEKSGYAKAMDEEFYRKQRELMTPVVASSDVVITTAAVPGKKAPILINRDMASSMKPGSVLVDIAAERGGNCELTCPGETTVQNGVTFMGPMNIPSTIPFDASQMYARNATNFLLNAFKTKDHVLDMADDIVMATIVTQNGDIMNGKLREILGLPALATGGEA
jgi:H+-translocating NAD(P) transhydrogenase subunit alpha